MEAETILEDDDQIEENADERQDNGFHPIRDTGKCVAFRLQLLQRMMGNRYV